MTDDDVVEAEAIEVEDDALPSVREPAPSTALVAKDEISLDELLKQSSIIEEAMRRAMTVDVHYGKIPGVNKPTLLKPGAEKLNVLFRLAPSYVSEKTWHEDGHLTVVAKCILTHIPTSYVVGEGEGLCTSREAKYAYRTGGRVCPVCGKDAIIKGKAEYGGGWLCFKRKGGCGEKWDDDTEQGAAFASMDTGRVPNEDLADTYNTVLKMADKRALVAAVLNSTAASDVFTQDVEDAPRGDPHTGHASDEPDAQPQEEKKFDPEVDRLPNSPAGTPDMMERLSAMQQHIDPTVDWAGLFTALVGARYGGMMWQEVEQSARVKFLARWTNAITRLQSVMTGDFPPLNDDTISDALAWAFEGVKIEVPHLVTSKEDA